MTKRPSKPQPGWATSLSNMDEQEQRNRYVAQPRVKGTKGEGRKTNITFFLAISTHARLKELALARNTSLQQLVAEAVDKWLAEQSEPAFKPKDE